MICRTRILNNHNGSAPLTRSNVACDLIYMANVDPGGYVPSSLTRAVSKREYPKFLTIFDAYCKAKVKGTEIDVKSL